MTEENFAESEAATESAVPASDEPRMLTTEEVNEIVKRRLSKVKTNPDEESAKTIQDLTNQLEELKTRAEKAEAFIADRQLQEEKEGLIQDFRLNPSLIQFLTGTSQEERRKQAKLLSDGIRGVAYPGRVVNQFVDDLSGFDDSSHKPKGWPPYV